MAGLGNMGSAVGNMNAPQQQNTTPQNYGGSSLGNWGGYNTQAPMQPNTIYGNIYGNDVPPPNTYFTNQGAGMPQNYSQGFLNINPYGYGAIGGGNFTPSQASANMNPSGYTPQQPTGGGFSGQFGGGLYGSEASNFVPQMQNPFASNPYSLNQGYNGLGSFGAFGGYGGGYSPMGTMMNYYQGPQQATAAPAPTTAPAVNYNQAAGNLTPPASGQTTQDLYKGGKV